MNHQHQSESTNAQLLPEHEQLVSRLYQMINQALSDTERVAATRSALGPDALIPYGEFLKANSISYDLGKRLRDEGCLKVLEVGGKLMVRRGHVSEFVRQLPLAN